MVYAEVLYDVATIRKIQGFYLKDPPVASCRCFFLCLFGAELFWQKKSQAGFTCDFFCQKSSAPKRHKKKHRQDATGGSFK